MRQLEKEKKSAVLPDPECFIPGPFPACKVIPVMDPILQIIPDPEPTLKYCQVKNVLNWQKGIWIGRKGFGIGRKGLGF
jgi:hypothetical protein